MVKNKFKIMLVLLCILLFINVYAVSTPSTMVQSEDRYSPSAQALGMGGSFANIWADDPQGMWENPAAVALFAHENRFGIGTSNLEWLNQFGSGTIAGGFGLGHNFTLGLGMTTVNWSYVPDEFSAKLFYGGLSSALSWHSFINASIGISAKSLYITYPDTMFARDKCADIGAIVEWPILATFDKGNLSFYGHEMHFDITPGVHYTFKNLGAEVSTNYLFGFNVGASLYDKSIGSELIHIKYAYDIKMSEVMNAVQIGFYDIFFMRFGNHRYGSSLLNASGYGLNYSHLIMNLVHALGADKEHISIVNQISIEQHWGNWSSNGQDVGIKGTTFLVKWESK